MSRTEPARTRGPRRLAARRWTWLALVLALGAAGTALVSAQGTPEQALAQVQTRPAPAGARTVIVVRHAEKDASGDPRDPGLSAAGRARAEALARMLAPSGVAALFASEYKRTQETLAPLAQRCGKEVRALPAGKPAELLAALEALPPGSVAVVAGHSNTVPALVRALGATVAGTTASPQGEMLAETAYGRMFVLTRTAGDAQAPAAPHTIGLIELAVGE